MPPLASTCPSKGVTIVVPSMATPIEPYTVISQDHPPVTPTIQLSKPSKEE